MDWFTILLIGAVAAVVIPIFSYYLYVHLALSVFRPYSESFPVHIDITESRMFFIPYVSADSPDLHVSVTNKLTRTYNASLYMTLSAFPSNEEVISSKSPVQLVPGKQINYGFPSEQLVPGQYIARADVRLESVEIRENGTTHYNSTQSEMGRLSFQVLSDQDVLNRIIAFGTIAGSSATAVAVFAQVRIARRRIIHDHNSRWKELYEAHSALLAEELDKNWKSDSGIFASHTVENNKFRALDPKEPESEYTSKVKDHLMEGYPDVWELYLKGKSDSVDIRNHMKSIAEQLRAKIVEGVSSSVPNLPQGTAWTPKILRFFDLEHTATAILNEIKWSRIHGNEIAQANLGKYNPGTGEILTQIYLHGVYLALGPDDEMKALKQALDSMTLDREVHGLVTEYMEQEKKLAENANIIQYQKRINEIVSDVRAGLPMKGKRSCQICEGLYEHIFTDSENE